MCECTWSIVSHKSVHKPNGAKFLSVLEKLRNCSSIHDLAPILGYQPKSLAYILYKIPEDQKYTSFSIPKKTGGERQIKAPVHRLKVLQKLLADRLYACVEEISSKKVHPTTKRKLPSLSHGFEKNHSITTNAGCHKSKRYVLNLDLENFFPSINFGRVRGFFIKSNDFNFHKNIATIIAQIACHENQLPQGSPCSPVISNLIGRTLDVRLVQLAKKHQCTYSRYADDITFSTNLKSFPQEIAGKLSDEASNWAALANLEKTIKKSGFSINHHKTRMQYSESRQVVTGLVVNKKVNTKAEYYRNVRAMCHSLFSTGEYYLPNTPTEKGTINQLQGRLSHIYYVKNFSDHREGKDKKISPTASTSLYADFLRYKLFYMLDVPLIICEGKTDSVYLKCALKKLYPNNTLLAEMAEGKLRYKIRFLNYSHCVKEILHLAGGTGDLTTLLYHYHEYLKIYRCSGKKNPVILLIDNDDGAKGKGKPYSAIKQINPSLGQVTGDQPFYFVTDNLYVVPTPKNNGIDTKIENFFPPTLLQTKLDGKIFNPENTQSGHKNEYGKHVFAEKVVKPNQASIDFGEFQKILTPIASAINDYACRLLGLTQ